MDWKNAEAAEGGLVKVPDQWLHLYYYEALNILFRFENALRVFVYVILKRELLADWDTAAIADGATIRTETKKRLAQAKDHGYLGYGVTSPMLYLNSGELLQILTSDTYWKHFAKYFKASKSIVQTKLLEIGTVRNSLAHFRPVKEDDIDLIKQNSKHVLLEIENCLTEITSISDAVPTNSPDEWYKQINSIGNDHIATSLYASPNEEWIRIELAYKIPTLSKEYYGSDFGFFKVGNIRTAQILSLFEAVRKNCIYVAEPSLYGAINEDGGIDGQKRVSIVFAKSRLATDYNDIAKVLKEIADRVQSETNLVAQDHLARGELIEVKTTTATKREENGKFVWRVNLESLATSLSEADFVEFWGQRNNYTSDFIAGTAQYPWMPSAVSKPGWF